MKIGKPSLVWEFLNLEGEKMLTAALEGIGIGLLLAILIGPVFFALVGTSINNGAKSAIFLALGISVSDIIYITLILAGLSSLIRQPEIITYMGIIGGGMLIVFGIQNLTKKVSINFDSNNVIGKKDIFHKIAQGFLLNSLHPGVALFWLASVGGIMSSNKFTPTQTYVMFGSTIGTAFCTDLLKIHLATKFKHLLTKRLVLIINILVGTIMSVSGIWLLYNALTSNMQ